MKPPLYILTAPPPPITGTDAVFQEVEALRQHFGGQSSNMYPLKKPSRWIPTWAMGWHMLPALRDAAAKASLIHVFTPTLAPFPALTGFGLPLVQTITANLGRHPDINWVRRHQIQVVTNNERDELRAQRAGIKKVSRIGPALDLSNFTVTPPPPAPPFKLLIGSAPWTKAQFRTKGIDALIQAAGQLADLHLVFLWRGLWINELEKRIQKANIADRVTVHMNQVDVNKVLADCHGAVVLAEHERLVKAWPHSAIESLAAGRPVLLSQTIPMSSWVKVRRMGTDCSCMDTATLLDSIETLRSLSASLDGVTTRRQAQDMFSPQTALKAHQHLYQQVVQ